MLYFAEVRKYDFSFNDLHLLFSDIEQCGGVNPRINVNSIDVEFEVEDFQSFFDKMCTTLSICFIKPIMIRS